MAACLGAFGGAIPRDAQPEVAIERLSTSDPTHGVRKDTGEGQIGDLLLGVAPVPCWYVCWYDVPVVVAVQD